MEINDKVYLFNGYDELRDEGIIIDINVPNEFNDNLCYKVQFNRFINAGLFYMTKTLGTCRFPNVGNDWFYIIKK